MDRPSLTLMKVTLLVLIALFIYPTPTVRTDEFVELLLINRDALLRHIYSNKQRQHYLSHF
jgi:hypothetical protein